MRTFSRFGGRGLTWMILILVAAASASRAEGQESPYGSWLEILKSAVPETARGTPPSPTFEWCDVPTPDSVFLVWPAPRLEENRNPVLSLAPNSEWPKRPRDGLRSRETYRPYYPSSPDTLETSVSHVECLLSGRRTPLKVFLRHDPETSDPFFIGYRLSDSWDQPLLFGRAENGTLSPVVRDPGIGGLSTRAAREQRIRSKGWPETYAQAVLDYRVEVGMSDEMVKEAWGRPDSVNRTTTTAGSREQWVYGAGRYVYLVEGAVTGIQTRSR